MYPLSPVSHRNAGISWRVARPVPMSRGVISAAAIVGLALTVQVTEASPPLALPPAVTGAAAASRPVDPGWLPQHPYMSSFGANTMHADGYGSNTHPFSGPVGRSPQVQLSYKGPCAGMTFTKEGLILLQCGGVQSFTLRLIDPKTMSDLATYNLPPRPSTIRAVVNLNPDKIYGDSSGAYFYIDNLDRVVLADAAQHIQRVVHQQDSGGKWSFRKVDDWDLTRVLAHDCETLTNPKPAGECDAVTSVLPDWAGTLWWVSRHGKVGTINPHSGAVHVISLGAEEIENSHSVSEDGVSVVTDHALYQMKADSKGLPTILWRAAYDRGSARKVGQINQGSGTTPTFLGRDYVTITDNADDRMHVLVFRRAAHVTGSRLVCAIPVFAHRRSATENSLVGWGTGIVVENNYGYTEPIPVTGRTTIAGGLARVDVNPGGKGCHTTWTSAEQSPSVVPKLSRGNGLLYFYTHADVLPNLDAWYLTAVDFRTGRTAYKVRVGIGPAYDNAFGPITVGPQGAVFVSIFSGIAKITDGN